MINFHDVIDRISSYQKNKIRELVMKNDMVDFEVLNGFTQDLKFRNILKRTEKKAVFKLLYSLYRNKENLNVVINDIELFRSEIKSLEEAGIIELEKVKPNHSVNLKFGIPSNFNPLPKITIINEQMFAELKKQTLKEFACFILLNERNQFLISLLDEISNRGPFSKSEILKIKEQIEKSQIRTNELNKDSLKVSGLIKNTVSTLPRENKRCHEGSYKTFMFIIIENNPHYFHDKNNKPLFTFWTDLISEGYIKKTKFADFRAIFLAGKIQKENRIIWLKTIKTLTEFIKALLISGKIVKLNGVDHWLITMDCFVLNNSKEIKLESILKPQNEDSKMKSNIETIVNKFISHLE